MWSPFKGSWTAPRSRVSLRISVAVIRFCQDAGGLKAVWSVPRGWKIFCAANLGLFVFRNPDFLAVIFAVVITVGFVVFGFDAKIAIQAGAFVYLE
jgi:hypothetical protein